MKHELKRIEATLHQLADQSRQQPTDAHSADVYSSDSHDSGSNMSSPAPVPPVSAGDRPSLFELSLPQLDVPQPEAPQPEAPPPDVPSLETLQLDTPQLGTRFLDLPMASVQPSRSAELPDSVSSVLSKKVSVEPFPIDLAPATPALPKVKSPSFTSHRNAANPRLAIGLLKELEVVVLGWQEELQQILRRIQDLYLEGPIIDGWLESYAHDDGQASDSQPEDVDCLRDYIDKMQSPAAANQSPNQAAMSDPAPRLDVIATGYRLCGLNEDGQLWFRPCPAHQVPAVGVAIARYQRLRQLLTRKQYLEGRLSQFAEMLVAVHGHLTT